MICDSPHMMENSYKIRDLCSYIPDFKLRSMAFPFHFYHDLKYCIINKLRCRENRNDMKELRKEPTTNKTSLLESVNTEKEKRKRPHPPTKKVLTRLYGDVSTLIFASFTSNSSLVGFLAHTRFLKFISTNQASDAIQKKTYAGS